MYLHIPCKKTKRFDISRLVQENLVSAVDAVTLAKLRPACDLLGEFRNAATAPLILNYDKYFAPSIEALRSNLKYINAVASINKIAPRLVEVRSDHVGFFWTDAFGADSAETTNIKLEIVSCAFNCGAIMAGLASSQARGAALGEAEVESASRMYQRAAGFFHHTSEMPYVVGGGTVDLHAPAHVACKFAMLANAQQCSYMQSQFKTVEEYSFESRAVLAAGARDLYRVTLSHLDSMELRNTSIGTSMIGPTRALMEYFAAEAENCLGHALEKANDFGNLVVRRRLALEAIKRAQDVFARSSFGKSAAYADFGPKLENQVRAFSISYDEAYERNMRIFHDVVPASLAAVEGQKVVEPSQIGAMFSTELKDPSLIELVQVYMP